MPPPAPPPAPTPRALGPSQGPEASAPRLPGSGATAEPPAPPAVPVPDDAIDVRVLPATVFVERTGAGQLLNCDLVVRNTSSASFVLGEIEASVYDRAGALVFRKFGSVIACAPARRSPRWVPPAAR